MTPQSGRLWAEGGGSTTSIDIESTETTLREDIYGATPKFLKTTARTASGGSSRMRMSDSSLRSGVSERPLQSLATRHGDKTIIRCTLGTIYVVRRASKLGPLG